MIRLLEVITGKDSGTEIRDRVSAIYAQEAAAIKPRVEEIAAQTEKAMEGALLEVDGITSKATVSSVLSRLRSELRSGIQEALIQGPRDELSGRLFTHANDMFQGEKSADDITLDVSVNTGDLIDSVRKLASMIKTGQIPMPVENVEMSYEDSKLAILEIMGQGPAMEKAVDIAINEFDDMQISQHMPAGTEGHS